MIQYNLRSLRLSCIFFVDMCVRQVSLRSRCIPRYFKFSACVSCYLGGRGGTRALFCGEINLDWFRLTCLHTPFFNQNWILFKCVCSLCVATAGSSCIVLTAVSSAQVAVVLSAVVGESAVYVRQRSGPNTLPAARQIEQGEGMYIPQKITKRFILGLVKLGGIRSLLLSLTINPTR